MWKLIRRLFGLLPNQDGIPAKSKKSFAMPMPITAGRSSIDPNAIYYNTDVPLDPLFPLQFLPILNRLSISHHDVSKAVDNIMSLANTKETITFDSNVSPRQARKMIQYLKEQEKMWINYSAGNTTLYNTLLRQIAVNGALSAERVINQNVTAIDKIVFVNPCYIRFIFKDGEYLPYQETPLQSDSRLGLKELNTSTYKYIPIVSDSDTPYGIPPFLAAIDALGIEKDLLDNFGSIAKKLGMLGFLEVLLDAPEQDSNESDSAYQSRMIDYRNSIAPQINEMLNRGYVVGFKDAHEFNLVGNNMNASGADKILQIADEIKMAGLKQDPNMFGRHTSVTETFGRVLLAVMMTQTKQYQKIIADFMNDTRLLSLQLAGFKVEEVITTFEEPLIGDQLKKEQTEGVKIDNLTKLYNQGIINQEQFALELGYDSPALPEPREQGDTSTQDVTGGDGADPSASTESEVQDNTKYTIHPSYSEFNYHIPHQCEDSFARTDWKDPLTQELADGYLDSADETYLEAVDELADIVANEVATLENPTEVVLQATVMNAIFQNWADIFQPKITPVVDENVPTIYDTFRSDTRIFPEESNDSNSKFQDAPEVVLDLVDQRVIEYFKESDTVFLSKFISDADTQRKITSFISDFYIENGEAIGDNARVINEFKNQFEGVLDGETWKIRRVLDTTVNKLRSYGNINYMNQANVARFEIVEIMDRITCPYCQFINGKTFEVSIAREKIQTVINGSVEQVGALSPFATTVPIEDWRNLSEEELQARGFDSPPFHPSCRGRVVIS